MGFKIGAITPYENVAFGNTVTRRSYKGASTPVEQFNPRGYTTNEVLGSSFAKNTGTGELVPNVQTDEKANELNYFA